MSTQADFLADREGVVADVNRWVSQKTNGKITDLISRDDLSPDTRLILLNAVHLLAEWADPFPRANTREDTFTLADGTQVRVPLMSCTGGYRYAETADAQYLEIPYKGNALSMLVCLPRTRDGLPGLEASWNRKAHDAVIAGLAEEKVEVFLPRFRVATPVMRLAGQCARWGRHCIQRCGRLVGNRDEPRQSPRGCTRRSSRWTRRSRGGRRHGRRHDHCCDQAFQAEGLPCRPALPLRHPQHRNGGHPLLGAGRRRAGLTSERGMKTPRRPLKPRRGSLPTVTARLARGSGPGWPLRRAPLSATASTSECRPSCLPPCPNRTPRFPRRRGHAGPAGTPGTERSPRLLLVADVLH